MKEACRAFRLRHAMSIRSSADTRSAGYDAFCRCELRYSIMQQAARGSACMIWRRWQMVRSYGHSAIRRTRRCLLMSAAAGAMPRFAQARRDI